MSFATRFMLAAAVLAIATTAALGFAVRDAWRRAEEAGFSERVESASQQLERDLANEVRNLPSLVQPLCEHDPVVDSTLVDLRTGRLDRGRRLSLSLRVPELMKALGFDELVLITGKGEVLGAGDPAKVGSQQPALVTRMGEQPEEPRLRSDTLPLAIEAYCMREDRGVRVGLYAARHFDKLLHQASNRFELDLAIGEQAPSNPAMSAVVTVREFGDLRVTATQSRVPLNVALRRLDATVLILGAGTLALALVVAALFARGLARPIRKLAAQAERAVHAEPQPVEVNGGLELGQLARSFNRAIQDLSVMRKRLAATERIAARREIARQVAHEIKNPLAPIRAAVETLRRLHARSDPAFDEYFDEATRTVLDEVNRITTIVQEFTRFARLPAPEPADCDLVALARRVVGLHSATCAGLGLCAGERLLLQADSDQIVQVLTNLVQNAIDAVVDHPEPKVEVRLRLDGEKARIEVEDNGPGVPPEFEERLFEPYATGKAHGTGLGLAIVERIVLEHAGEIRHERPQGGGARFVVLLPLDGPGLLPEPPPASHPNT